jgi:succinyl-CoA synthetase alpha subunit
MNNPPLDPGRIAVIDVPPAELRAAGLAALAAGSDLLIPAEAPLVDEIALKAEAAGRGLLVLGPGSSGALVAGRPFGAASRVRAGNVGMVGSSASALHEVAALLHRLGAGVSHALHVGPNDVTDDVGGVGTLAALRRLEDDGSTDVIAIVGRPPARAAADAILKQARALSRSVVICFVGSNVRGVDEHMAFVRTLHDAALAAAELSGAEEAELDPTPPRPLPHRPGLARALCTGAALAAEAAMVWKRRLGRAASDVPAPGLLPLEATALPDAHCALDVSGLPCAAYRDRLRAAASDPATAALMVDLVLGLQAPADSATALLEALREARAARPDLPLIASVVGTDDDPLPRGAQVALLEAAGIVVAPSNAVAATWAAQIAK